MSNHLNRNQATKRAIAVTVPQQQAFIYKYQIFAQSKSLYIELWILYFNEDRKDFWLKIQVRNKVNYTIF